MLKKLGEQIRKLRKDKKLTLVEIAERTGIAQATLSRIETGTMTGTVESHAKIAEAIGVGLAELYQTADEREDTTEVRKKEEIKAPVHHQQQAHIEILTAESSSKKITPLLVTLQGNGETASESLERGVEKFFYVLEGEVKARVGQKDYSLKSGDTLYFDASLSHKLSNEKKSIAKILAAVSPSKL